MGWSSRSLGSRLQHKLFYFLIAVGGVRAAYALLFWVIMWYTCWPSVSRRSAAYLQRRFPKARWGALWLHRFCLHWEFGKCLVDRAAAGITGKFHIYMDEAQKQQLRTAHGEGKGLIVVASHVGCWHMSMSGLAELLPGPTSVVLHRDKNDVDRHYYEHSDKAPPFAIIDPSLGALSTVAMLQCVQKGGVLGLMGDRVFDNARLCEANFMGSAVGFPYLAYYLASVSAAPVAVFFAYRTKSGESCHVLADIIRVPPGLGKEGKAYAPYVGLYAEALEGSVAVQPYQFFNFYDMWGGKEYNERERKT